MSFQFTCPYCFKKTWVEESLAGQEGGCAGCGKKVKIPEPPIAAPANMSPAETPRAARRVPATALWAMKFAGFAAFASVIVGIAAFLLWPWFQGLRLRRDRITCMGNLQTIAAALNEYAAEHGTYPTPIVYDPRGKALYSWRVLILPQLGEETLYSQFNLDEPWDSTANSSLTYRCPSIYISPSSAGTFNPPSSYVLITGKNTIFPASGPLGPTDIRDPSNSTLLVAETGNTACTWSQPTDIDISKLNNQIGRATGTLTNVPTSIGGNHADGATVAFVDGKPGWIPDDTASGEVRAMISPRGGEKINTNSYRME